MHICIETLEKEKRIAQRLINYIIPSNEVFPEVNLIEIISYTKHGLSVHVLFYIDEAGNRNMCTAIEDT